MSPASVALRSMEEQHQFLEDYPPVESNVAYYVEGERFEIVHQIPQADYSSETVIVLTLGRSDPRHFIRVDSIVARSYGASQATFVYATEIQQRGLLIVPGVTNLATILALEGANRDVMFSWRSETIEP